MYKIRLLRSSRTHMLIPYVEEKINEKVSNSKKILLKSTS